MLNLPALANSTNDFGKVAENSKVCLETNLSQNIYLNSVIQYAILIIKSILVYKLNHTVLQVVCL